MPEKHKKVELSNEPLFNEIPSEPIISQRELPKDLLIETGARVVFIDNDAFYANVEKTMRPGLEDKPVAVRRAPSENTSVIAASYEAKAKGVKSLMPIWQARKLCPELVVLEGRDDLYRDISKDIVSLAAPYFKRIEVLSIDEMSCFPDDSHRNVKDCTDIVAKFKNDLRDKFGDVLTASAGIAPNTFIAKVGSDMNKPNGLTILDKDYPEKLTHLKLTDLPGIAEAMAARLRHKGIFSIADLYHASPTRLRDAWGGVGGYHWYDMIRGSLECDYGLNIPKVRRSITRSRVLSPDKANLDGLKETAYILLTDALETLRKEGLCTRKLSFGVSFYPFLRREVEPFRAEELLSWPVCDYKTWAEILSQKLLPQSIPRGVRPRGIWLAFSKIEGLAQRQPLLFELFDTRGEKISLLVDDLNKKFGTVIQFGSAFFNESPRFISFGPPDR
jgi:DNA polymerase-4